MIDSVHVDDERMIRDEDGHRGWVIFVLWLATSSRKSRKFGNRHFGCKTEFFLDQSKVIIFSKNVPSLFVRVANKQQKIRTFQEPTVFAVPNGTSTISSWWRTTIGDDNNNSMTNDKQHLKCNRLSFILNQNIAIRTCTGREGESYVCRSMCRMSNGSKRGEKR